MFDHHNQITTECRDVCFLVDPMEIIETSHNVLEDKKR